MFTIRPATYADSAELAHIQVDSYRHTYAGILPEEYLADFTYEEQTYDWQELLATEQGFILLAAEDENGNVVGYALGHTGQTGIPPFESELDALHVRYNHQRQGIGRALIGALAGRLQAAGADSLMLWVLVQNPARSLYERLGGQPLGRRAITLGHGNVAEETVAEEVAYGWEDITTLAGK